MSLSAYPRCNRLVPDAHGTQSACDGHTVDAIPVPDHVAGGIVPGECLRDLSCNPFGGRMCRDVDPDKISAVEPKDDEGKEQFEAQSLGQRISPWLQCPARGYARWFAILGLVAPVV